MRTTMTATVIFAASLSATRAPAQVERETRIFDLGFLAAAPPRPAGALPETPTIRGLGLGTVGDPSQQGNLEYQDPETEELLAAGSLRMGRTEIAEAVRALIAPASWGNARNRLEPSGKRLVVTQSPAVVERIAGLLVALEARASRRVRVDLAIVPPSALDAAAPGWTRPGGIPWLPAEAFEAAVRSAGAEASVLSGFLPEGERVRMLPRAVSRRIVDVEVNQTGVIPVRNPVIGELRSGAFAEVLVLRSPGGGWFRIDLVLGRASPAGEPAKRKTSLVEIDLVSERQDRIETSAVVPEGRTLVAGLIVLPEPGAPAAKSAGAAEAPCAGGFVALARIVAAGPESAAEETAGEPFAILDAGLLLEIVPRFRIEPAPSPYESGRATDFGSRLEDGRGGPVSAEVLDEVLGEESPAKPGVGSPPWRRRGTILLDAADPERVARVRGRLDELARARAKAVVVDLWRGDVGTAELAAAGSSGPLLGPDWLDRMAAAPGLRARVSSLGTGTAAVASVEARNHVADLDRVSGGTSFLILEEADPVIRRSAGGTIANVSASVVPGRRWVEVRVDGETAAPPRLERSGRARESGNADISPGGTPGPIADAPDAIDIDLPEESSDVWAHAIAAPLGTPVLLNALPDPDRPGRTRALVAVVHEFAP